jgi:hypothetical protein
MVLSANERGAPIAKAEVQLAAITTEAIKANFAFDPNLVLNLIYLAPLLDDLRLPTLHFACGRYPLVFSNRF